MFFPIALFRFIRIIRNNPKNVVLSFLFRADIVNAISNLFYPHKMIMSIETNIILDFSMDDNPIKRYIFPLIARIIYRKANLILVVSKGVGKSIIEKFGISPKKVVRIYNGFDIDKISKMAKESLGDKYSAIFENPTIINIGRLGKQKGQEYLIRIFAKVVEQVPDVYLFIIGKGELLGKLKKISRDSGVANKVIFPGFVDNPYKYLSKGRLYVSTSLWEGFGNTLVEALSCGINIISSDCQFGPREIISPGTDPGLQIEKPEFSDYGILMPALNGGEFDSEEKVFQKERLWAEVIIEQLSKKSSIGVRMKLVKRAQDFSIEKIADRYVQVINSIFSF